MGDVLPFRRVRKRPKESLLSFSQFLSFSSDLALEEITMSTNTKWIVALVLVAALTWYVCMGRKMPAVTDGTPPPANPLGT